MLNVLRSKYPQNPSQFDAYRSWMFMGYLWVSLAYVLKERIRSFSSMLEILCFDLYWMQTIFPKEFTSERIAVLEKWRGGTIIKSNQFVLFALNRNMITAMITHLITVTVVTRPQYIEFCSRTLHALNASNSWYPELKLFSIYRSIIFFWENMWVITSE